MWPRGLRSIPLLPPAAGVQAGPRATESTAPLLGSREARADFLMPTVGCRLIPRVKSLPPPAPASPSPAEQMKACVRCRLDVSLPHRRGRSAIQTRPWGESSVFRVTGTCSPLSLPEWPVFRLECTSLRCGLKAFLSLPHHQGLFNNYHNKVNNGPKQGASPDPPRCDESSPSGRPAAPEVSGLPLPGLRPGLEEENRTGRGTFVMACQSTHWADRVRPIFSQWRPRAGANATASDTQCNMDTLVPVFWTLFPIHDSRDWLWQHNDNC